jgi:hypothetical protein
MFMRSAIAISLVFAFAACKSAKVAAPATPPPMPQVTGPVDEPSKALPADFYKTMPIYPGAAVDHVRKPKGAMREIVFSSDAQMQQMVAYYKDALKKNDFHITSSLIMPARKTWSCDFNYDGHPGSIMLYPDDQNKAQMTIDLIYEIPAHVDESMMEPKEDWDVEGPGAVAQQNPNPNSNEDKKRN